MSNANFDLEVNPFGIIGSLNSKRSSGQPPLEVGLQELIKPNPFLVWLREIAGLNDSETIGVEYPLSTTARRRGVIHAVDVGNIRITMHPLVYAHSKENPIIGYGCRFDFDLSRDFILSSGILIPPSVTTLKMVRYYKRELMHVKRRTELKDGVNNLGSGAQYLDADEAERILPIKWFLPKVDFDFMH